MNDELIDRARGCLLGGAIGDSLGAPIEFMSLARIRSLHGPDGIQELHSAYGLLGAITDDTQMTLFSGEGLIRRWLMGASESRVELAYAYGRWLLTQGREAPGLPEAEKSRGWLIHVPELHHARAPGKTCVSSLLAWRGDDALNDSKGCGTVMRSAPFAFSEDPWQEAWDAAAITHGHIEAKASAAILAQTIRYLLQGEDLESALRRAADRDLQVTNSSRLVYRAIELAEADVPPELAFVELGQGWVADEALGIAAYCALRGGSDFAGAVRLAVNHSGDSDSTGAITGNLVGAAYGSQVLPERWLGLIELRKVITQLATDLAEFSPLGAAAPTMDLESRRQRYLN